MAGNNNGFQRPQRTKNALDNNKLNMTAPTPSDPNKKSSLIWGFYANNPRLTVWTNEPNDTDAISANLDTPTFFAFIELLRKAIDAEPGYKDKIENKNYTWFNKKRSDTPSVVSDLIVGKDKDGVIGLCIVQRDRPRIRFNFGVNEFHQFIHGDGTPYTPAEMSTIYAKAYLRILDGMYNHMAIVNYEPPKPREQNDGGNNRGGQGGGNYQRNNGGGNGGGGNYNGGGGNQQKDMDDDIPF
jgi:uncharacterized membrane protein YgcG